MTFSRIAGAVLGFLAACGIVGAAPLCSTQSLSPVLGTSCQIDDLVFSFTSYQTITLADTTTGQDQGPGFPANTVTFVPDPAKGGFDLTGNFTSGAYTGTEINRTSTGSLDFNVASADGSANISQYQTSLDPTSVSFSGTPAPGGSGVVSASAPGLGAEDCTPASTGCVNPSVVGTLPNSPLSSVQGVFFFTLSAASPDPGVTVSFQSATFSILGQTSQPPTSTPEPASLLLFGSGLSAFALEALRRRSTRK